MILEVRPEKNKNIDWLAEQTKQLLSDQKKSWPFLKSNYDNLSSVQTRSFEFDGFEVDVQFNPERIKSSNADVSKEAINGRQCFLCLQNLPDEQNGLATNNFLILCNPYPIFPEHFTIARRNHEPQSIENSFEELLDFSHELGRYYTLFYNGPHCGASAPDHLHFQAAAKNIMPLERQFDGIINKYSTAVFSNGNTEIHLIEDGLRSFISFESRNKRELLSTFFVFLNAMKKAFPLEDEPMMNITASFEHGIWRVFVFPRNVHRPKQFFSKEENQLLISPAAVDLCGLIITPRKEDFEKITRGDIIDIFKQITITKEHFEFLRKKLGEAFTF